MIRAHSQYLIDKRLITAGHFPLKATICPELKKVLDELRRWESMPNRREPYTVAMHAAPCRRARNSPPYELRSALTDWFGAMLQAGGRLSEWAQPKGASEFSKVTKNFRGDPKAFCLGDVEFLGEGKRRLSTAFALSHRRQVRYVNITWRTQKNGQHGEIVMFSHSARCTDLDVVNSWLNIVARFLRLVGHRADLPLAIYRDPVRQSTLFITSTEIDALLQSLAVEAYPFNRSAHRDLIARFTSHSPRVGACVVLQALGWLPSP
jgi:hypothetical protein